ncbi:YadA-like family protein [Advenella incenata]|nr:YadA-like family protein [Advenella incenata]
MQGDGTLKISAKTATLSVTDGKVSIDNGDVGNGKLVTAGSVANAINESHFNVNASATADGEVSSNGESPVKAGDTVNYIAGKNIKLTQADKAFTFETKDDVSFNKVSIGAGGLTVASGGKVDMGGNKITNVGDGSAPGDAVNFSQLDGVKTIADNALSEASKGWNLQANGDTATKVAPGDKVRFLDGTNINVTRNGNDLTIATTPALTADSLTINNGGPVINGAGIDMGGKKVTNVADGSAPGDAVNFSQLDGVKTIADNALSEASKGWNLQANGDAASKVALGDTVQFIDGTNINVTRNGNDLTIATTPALTADSLTINNGGPVINGAGIDMGGKKIAGVANGTEGTDAVNLNQLNAVAGAAASEVAAGTNIASVQKTEGANGQAIYTVNAKGTAVSGGSDKIAVTSTTDEATNLTTYGVDLSDAVKTSLTKADSALQEIVTQIDGADVKTLSSADNKVNFTAGDNIALTNDSGAIKIGVKPDLTADSLTINNGGPVINGAGIDMGGKKVTNVADGSAPGDAVNFSQLDGVKTIADNALSEASKGWNLQANGDAASKVALGDTVQFIDGTNINVTRNGNDLTIATTPALTADSLTINNGGPVINGAGIDMGGKKIAGVANGTEGTDAINLNQLNAVAGAAASEVAAGTNIASVQKTEGANGQAIYTVNAKGAAVSGGSDKIVVTSTTDDATNLTTYGVDLSDAVKTSLTKADSALQEIVTQIDGADVKTLSSADNKVNFTSGDNIALTNDSGAIKIGVKPDLTVDSLTINNGGPVINGAGIDMGGKKVTNVADGSAPGDAVNFSQLDGVKTIADNALSEASKGWNLQANGDAASKVALGDTVQFIDGTNINVTRNGNDLTIATTPALTADSLTINNGGPVIGSTGVDMKDKKLTYVAPGTLSADSKDGVNASQLFAVGNSTAAAFGGDSVFNPDTGVVVPSLNVGDKTFTNVNDALGDLNTTLASTTAEVNKGWNLQANGDAATKVAPGDKVQFLDGTNINVTRNGNDLTIATTPTLTADSLTINGGPVINSAGIDMGGKKIAGVANGTEGTDAVNLNQLNAVAGAAASEVAAGTNIASVQKTEGANGQAIYTVNAKGAAVSGGSDKIVVTSTTDDATNLTTYGVDLSDAVKTSLTKADSALQEIVTQIDGADVKTLSSADNKVNFTSGDNIALTNDSGAIKIGVKPDLTADSLTINNGGPIFNVDGINMNDKKITGIADGTGPKDAVNVSQLDAVKQTANQGWNLTANGSDSINIAPGETVDLSPATGDNNIVVGKTDRNLTVGLNRNLNIDSIQVGDTLVNGDGLTITGGPNVKKSGIDAGGKKIAGVANGTEGTDAVNLNQLNAVAGAAASEVAAGTNIASVQKTEGANGQAIYTVNAKGTAVSGGSDKIVVTSTTDDATNLTTYGVDLSDAVKTSLTKADSALQEIVTQIDGADVKTLSSADNKVNFTAGDNIALVNDSGAIKINVTPDLTVDSLTINNGGPVIGSTGIDMQDKKLTNVAPGTLSADSKDGINASQLFAVGNSTAAAFGGDSTFNPDTGVVVPSLNVGDKTFTNVNDALGDLNTTLASTTAEVNKGWNLQANGDAATKVAPGDKVQFLDGTNINVSRDGNDLTIATTPALTADSLTINGGPVISGAGIDMGGKKVTGIANGTEGTDAVNLNQLNAVAGAAASEVAAGTNIASVQKTEGANGQAIYTVNAKGTAVSGGSDKIAVTSTTDDATNLTTYNVDLSDAAKSSLTKADSALQSIVTQIDGADVKTLSSADNKVNFTSGDNIALVNDNGAIKINVTPDLTVDSLTINNGGPVIGSTGIDMQDKKLTNVAPGTLSADSKDGVNASQLFAVGNSTAAAFGGDSTFNPDTGVVVPSLNVGDKTFTNVNDALSDLNTTLASTTAEVNKGWNLQANGDTATKVAPGDKVQFLDGTNINVTRTGNDLTIATWADLKADSLTINNGGPVIGSTGIDMQDKKLTNVAPGTLSADSKDGVNASQLFAVGNSTAAAFGGDSTFNPDTGVVVPSLNVGDKTFTNVNDALGDLNTTLASTTAEVNKGWNLQANGDAATKVAPGDKVQFLDGTNINVTRTGNDLTIATWADLKADSLTINNGGPVFNVDGINMNDKKLTNVAAGTLSADSKDGVNAGQLFTVGDSTAQALGGDSIFDPVTGKVTAGLKIGDKTFNNVNSALTAINDNVTSVATRGWDIAGATGVVGSVATGGQVQFLAGDNHTKVNVAQENGISKVTVSTAASPLQYSDTANANGQNAAAAPFEVTNSVTLVGKDAAAPVSLNNVAKATLSEDSLQAVNGQQLYGLGNSIANTLGGGTYFNADTGTLSTKIRVDGSEYNSVADALDNIGRVANGGWNLQLNNDTPQKVGSGATVGFNQGSNIQLTRDGNQVTVATAPNVTFESVKADRLEGDVVSAKSYLGVIDGPALTQQGIDAAGKPISNVGPGDISEGSTDAVTGGQLYSLAGGTAAAINRLQSNLDRVAKDANAGSATAGAMANLPQAYLPGKSMFALATARYVGQQGFAAGLSKVSDNGNWIIKGSVSGNTRGKTMVGAGIGYQW